MEKLPKPEFDDLVWILFIILGSIGLTKGHDTFSITLIAISIIMLTYNQQK